MTDNSLLQDFIVETSEHLEETERNLLRLEQHSTDVSVLNDIFRSVHTIKGSSEYLGLERIAELSHKLESLLDLLRRGERELEVKVIDLLIDTNDRLSQLIEDLSKHEQERTAIDDLVGRIDGLTGFVTPVSAEEAAGETISEGDWDAIEDEYDEELFGIFVDQLKDNILGIIEENRKLLGGESPDTVLPRYEDRLGILQSSANYMGYDKLKQVYTQWEQAVAQALKGFGNGDQVDWHRFSQDTTKANIDRVKAFFPNVEFLQALDLTSEIPDETEDSEESDEEIGSDTLSGSLLLDDEALDFEPIEADTLEIEDIGLELPDEGQAASPSDENISPELALFSDDEDDLSADLPAQEENPLLNDFLIETREHLDITERNALRLEQQPDDPELLNEIFRSIHTIKGSSEYLGLDRIAELSHKLESLLDLLRRGERSVGKKVIDLLISANDRIAKLVDELEKHQVEQSSIDDVLSQILEMIEAPVDDGDLTPESPADTGEQQDIIDEEYDGELFTIFIDQLKDGFQALCTETRELIAEQDVEKSLNLYGERLSTLSSAANYMGYEKVKDVYDQWADALGAVRNDCSEGQSVNWHSFATDVTALFIARIAGFFPQVDLVSALDLDFEVPVPASIEPEPEDVSLIDEEIDLDSDITTSADQSLLADFIAETKEHLEEVEHNLLLLGQTPQDVDVLNDLFRSVHTIKGSSEYLGMERIAELSHKLESLLDTLRSGQRVADTAIVELLISANDRIGQLIEDLIQNRSEETDIVDLIAMVDQLSAAEQVSTAEQVESEPETSDDTGDLGEGTEDQPETAAVATEIVYREEYDQELFTIFQNHFNEGIQALSTYADQLRSGVDASVTLPECKKLLVRLRSSANYMEYGKLTTLYDNWIGEVDAAIARHTSGDAVNMAEWPDQAIVEYIEKARSFFMSADSEALFDAIPEIAEGRVADETPVSTALTTDEPASVGAVEDTVAPETEESAVVDIWHDIQPPADEIPVEDMTDLMESFATDTSETTLPSLASLDVDIPQDDLMIPSLDDVEDDIHDEQSLLARLENAFDAKIEEVSSTDFSALSKLDMVNELLSEDEASEGTETEISFGGPSSDPAAGKALDLRNLESFLSSGSDATASPAKVVTPAPLASITEQVDAPFAATEDDGRSKGRQLGRRRSDRFHERLLKQSIRVDATKIDSLMNQVGELVVTRAGFTQLFSEMHELQLMLKQAQLLDIKEMQIFKELTSRINDATVSLGRITSELQENVMKVRMLPIAQLFSRYPRVVHDLIRNTEKKVDLDIRGEETELDRMVIEQISDPLIHIIRNAVDHGIEFPDERQQKGKAENGVLRLEAYHEGNYVVIEVADDGQGINTELVKNKAISKGFVTAEAVADMNQDQIMGLIMLPGFSTTDEVTTTSGRGVGMDVVKDKIEKLNGTIETLSTPDKGTLFRIKIPLTLAIIPALMINVAGETFTIPLSAVDETIRIHRNEISTIEGIEVYYLRESTLPLIRVADVFKMKGDNEDASELFVVVVNTGNRQVGLIVDQLKGREEVVVKPLEDYLQEKSGFSGATILGDGTISLILDVADLVNIAVDQHMRKRKAAAI